MSKTAEHPSGEVITFVEEDHSYVDTRGVTYTSVTSFIHDDLFPKFDTETNAARVAARKKCSVETIKKQWQDKCDTASAYGTRVHAYAEAMLRGWELPAPQDEQDKESFEAVARFVEKTLLPDNTFVASEKIVFSPKYRLAGTVDLLVKDKSGRLFILDWKTNQKLKMDNVYGQYGLGELSHLPDCNYSHYCAQLNIYRRIMEEEGYFRGAANASMALLFINRDLARTEVQVYPVPRMDSEIEYIFGKRS